MSATTTNLALVKPESTDDLDISVINGNMDTIDGNVVATVEQSLTSTQQAQARANIGAMGAGEAVSVNAQTLTLAQQAQVRTNIGTVARGEVVRVSEQTLTSGMKAQARENIDVIASFAKEYNEETSSKISDLVAGLIGEMDTEGVYTFSGSWTGRSYGYDAICLRKEFEYDVSNTYTHSGTVYGHDGTIWTFTKRNSQSAVIRSEGFSRFVKVYNSVVIPSTGYVQIDSIDDMKDPLTNEWMFLISMNIRGWSGMSIPPVSLAKSSTGSDIYLMGSAQTIASLQVEYFFIESIARDLSST